MKKHIALIIVCILFISSSAGYCKSETLIDIVNKYTPVSVKLKGETVDFSYPLTNPQITSRYGYRIHPVYKTKMLHSGLDMVSDDPVVKAIESGIVVRTKYLSGYGNTVVVVHRNGWISSYSHLKEDGYLVKVGDVVKKGDSLGIMGDTGTTTGVHLHLEIFFKGIRTNPEVALELF